uniref:Kelch domain-containing protein n=1 Tax=Panagrellus redivivus TaxID=6233 RepID=A0A7E4VZJ0_PANRE
MWWTIHLDGGPRRVNHAAVALGDAIYSFGGYCSGPNYDADKDIDVFVLDTVTYRWYQITPRKARQAIIGTVSASKLQEEEEHTRLSGYDSDDVHPYTIAAENPRYKSVPYQRYGHTVVAYDGKAYLWGGRNDQYGSSSDLHEYNPETRKWTSIPVKGTIPPARDGHTAVTFNDKMYIFGGFENSHRLYSNSVYAYSFATKTWEHLTPSGPAPSHRDFHASCILGNKMYIFGGRGDEQLTYQEMLDTYCDKLYALDLVNNEWEEVKAEGDRPSGRRSHSMWTYNGQLYLFGGYTSTNEKHFNDFYVFNPETKTWTRQKPVGQDPSPRRRQCSAVVGDRVFLFGGTTPEKDTQKLIDLADMYVLDYAVTLKTLAAKRVVEVFPKGVESLPYLGYRMNEFLVNIVRPNTITSTISPRANYFG